MVDARATIKTVLPVQIGWSTIGAMLVFAICWDVIGPAVLVVPFAVLVLDGLKMLAVMYTQRCISYDLVPAWVRRSAESYVKFEHKTRQSLLDEDGRTQLKRFVPSWEWMRVHRIVCVRMVATGELPLNKGDHHAHRVGDNVDCWLWGDVGLRPDWRRPSQWHWWASSLQLSAPSLSFASYWTCRRSRHPNLLDA